MKKQTAKVIIASEREDVQYLLREMVEKGGGAVAVGQAQDAPAALVLARNLKPDYAIIDLYLPYTSSSSGNRLSRMGGLDIAQSISEEMPNMGVILLNNLDAGGVVRRGLSANMSSNYFIGSVGDDIPMALQSLTRKAEQTNPIVFASIKTKRKASSGTGLSDKIIFFGGLAVALGWLLTITIMFAPAGIPLALAGVVTLSIGLAGKLAASLRLRLLKRKETGQVAKAKARAV